MAAGNFAPRARVGWGRSGEKLLTESVIGKRNCAFVCHSLKSWAKTNCLAPGEPEKSK